MKRYFERHDGRQSPAMTLPRRLPTPTPAPLLATRLDAFSAGTRRPAHRASRPSASMTPPHALSRSAAPAHYPATPGQPDKLPVVIRSSWACWTVMARPWRWMPAAPPRPPCAGPSRAVLRLREHRARARALTAAWVLGARGAGRRLSDAALLVLLRQRQRPLQPLEASQRLALNRHPAAFGRPVGAVLGVHRGMRAVLRHPDLDPAFELVLTLPGEAYIAEQLDVVDPRPSTPP